MSMGVSAERLCTDGHTFGSSKDWAVKSASVLAAAFVFVETHTVSGG
jgi:hypothetical protein